MTFHIAITLLVLLLFLFSLLSMVRSKAKVPPPFGLTVAIALILILASFPFVVLLSHFVFEATSDDIRFDFRFKIVFSVIWLATGVVLWQYATKQRQIIASFAYTTIYSLLGFWGYLGVVLSQYEFAPTHPNLNDGCTNGCLGDEQS